MGDERAGQTEAIQSEVSRTWDLRLIHWTNAHFAQCFFCFCFYVSCFSRSQLLVVAVVVLLVVVVACCPSFFCSVLSRRVSSSVLCFRLALFACNFSALMENIVAYHRKSGEVFFFAPPRTPFCVRTLSVHTDNSNNNNKSSTHEHDFDKINGHINLSQRAPCGSLRLCVINLIKISLAASSFF